MFQNKANKCVRQYLIILSRASLTLIVLAFAIQLFAAKTFAVVPGGPGSSSTGGSSSSSSSTTSNTTPTPGCYIEQTNNSSGAVSFPSTSCPTGQDAGGYNIQSDVYCYVSDNADVPGLSSPSFAQEPCTSLVCQEGQSAIAADSDPNVDCTPGASDNCFGKNSENQSIPTSDQSESCSKSCSAGLCNSIVTNYVDPIIRFLGAGVGLVIVIMVVVGGIQYTTSGGNAQAIENAKKRIANAIIALVAFGLMYALLNFIIPGGVF